MKVPMSAISCLLLFITAIALESESKPLPRGPYHPTECCFAYATSKVLRQRITDYYETSSQCSKPGVVFITKKGHFICANPSDDWVQDYIKELEDTE